MTVLPKMLGPLPHSPGPLPSFCSSAGVVLTAFSENVYTQHPPKRGISQDEEETAVGGSAQGWSEESRYNSWGLPSFYLFTLFHSMKY